MLGDKIQKREEHHVYSYYASVNTDSDYVLVSTFDLIYTYTNVLFF